MANTILLLSANDPDNKLNQLSNEVKNIQRILNTVPIKDYEVALLPDAGITDLIQELMVPNRELEIIHYAGHANSSFLQLTDGNAQAKDLAEKLRMHTSVKVIFLNGCATKGQVDFFHEVGIPFVIATSRPIDDIQAAKVAFQLYLYLSLGRNLKNATRELETDMRLIKEKNYFRGIVLQEHINQADEFPWGLYPAPDRGNDDYNLPFLVNTPQQEIILTQTGFLKNLITSMAKLSYPQMSKIIELNENLVRGTITDSKMISELHKVLPLPLATRLRDITAKIKDRSSDYYRGLLYDYATLFDTLLHNATAVLLAQIWQTNQVLNPELKDAIKDYLVSVHLVKKRIASLPNTGYLPIERYKKA